MEFNFSYYPFYPSFCFQPYECNIWSNFGMNEQEELKENVKSEEIRLSKSFDSLEIPAKLPSNKKHTRIWTKQELEDVFNSTLKYCQQQEISINDLKFIDFIKISEGKRQSPEQIMIKINEIKVNGTLRPGKWSIEEDNFLASLVSKREKSWGLIAKILNSEMHSNLSIRNSKTCKERWNNYLDPSINKGAWTRAEILQLMQGYLQYGNKWKSITRLLPNRLEGAIKNKIKSILKKIKQTCIPGEDLNKKIQEIFENGSKVNLSKLSFKESFLDSFI